MRVEGQNYEARVESNAERDAYQRLRSTLILWPSALRPPLSACSQCVGQELNLHSLTAGGLQPLGLTDAQPTRFLQISNL